MTSQAAGMARASLHSTISCQAKYPQVLKSSGIRSPAIECLFLLNSLSSASSTSCRLRSSRWGLRCLGRIHTFGVSGPHEKRSENKIWLCSPHTLCQCPRPVPDNILAGSCVVAATRPRPSSHDHRLLASRHPPGGVTQTCVQEPSSFGGLCSFPPPSQSQLTVQFRNSLAQPS